MSAGVVYVELDLDYTKFERNQKKLDTEAKSTALNIEKVHGKVSAQAADYYRRMANAIIAEHNRVLNSDKYTAAQKAKAYTDSALLFKNLNIEMATEAARASRVNAAQIAREKADRDAQLAHIKRNDAAQAEANRLYEEFWAKKQSMYKAEAQAHEMNASLDEARINKQNKENAEWWMAKMRYDKDVLKSGEEMWNNLGIKSKAHYEAQKKEATSAYNTIKANAAKNGEDLTRIHKAYVNRMKALDDEYVGAHSMSMSQMVNGALRLYAAYYVVSSVLGTIVNFLKEGMEKADQMKTSAIAVAASITTAQGSPENFEKNYRYASALVEKLREVDKVSFATYENILLMNRAMELQGVHLDMNNQKQMDTFTSLTNAVALYTSGQDQAKQASQEIRSIFSGNIKAGSEVARIIDQQAKASGKYANGLADIVKQSKNHKDILERIAPFLIGIDASVAKISTTWESATTSMATSWNRLQRLTTEALFPNAVQQLKDFAAAVDAWAPKIALGFRRIADVIFWANTQQERIQLMGVTSLMPGTKVAEDAARGLTVIENAIKKREQDTLDLEQKLLGFTRIRTGENVRQYSEVKKIEDSYGNILNYGKLIAETPTTPNQTQELDNLKAQVRELAKKREAAKDAYEEAIRAADMAAKLAQKNGQFEKTTIAETYKAKTDAARDYAAILEKYSRQEVAARQKAAKLDGTEYDAQETLAANSLAIQSELHRNLQGFADDKRNSLAAAADKMIETELELSRIISATSESTTDKAIEDIKRRFKEHHRFTAQTVEGQALLDKALDRTIEKYKAQTDATRLSNRVSFMEEVSPFSEDAFSAFEESLNAQSLLMEDTFRSEAERQAWLTSKTLEEIEKRKSAQASYYEGIRGFEERAYQDSRAAIEAARQAEIEKGYDVTAANRKASRAILDLNEKRFDAEHADILKTMGATEEMFGNAKALMGENSKAYKVFHNAEMAMKAAQIAIEVQKQLSIAAGAAQQVALLPSQLAVLEALAIHHGVVATVAQGTDPITGPARMAAMAAAVSGILAIAGIGFTALGGSGGEVANPNIYADGTGSLLGSTEASQSSSKVLEILEDAHALEYGKLVGIYEEVRNLNSNITGLVKGTVMSDISVPVSPVTSKAKEWFKDEGAGAWYNSLVSGIMGGDKTTSQVGGGLAISGTTMGEILDGTSEAVGRFFRDMKTVTDGGWFHSDKTKFWTTYSALDDDTNRLLTQVFTDLGTTMLALAEGFGVDITDALNQYEVNIGKIDLMGKSADEITETLTAAFSEFGDQMVETLFGSIVEPYQKVNEGLLETAVRLLADMEQVLRILDYTNQGFTGSTESAIALSEALIEVAGDLDTLTDSFSTYYAAFFSDEEKAVDQQKALSESLTAMNMALPNSREGFRNLVESLDLTTDSGQQAYVSLLQLAETADSYYSYLEELQEKAVDDIKNRVSDWESALDTIQKALGTFADTTAGATLMAIDDIIRQTEQGIIVSSSDLSNAVNAAANLSTEAYTSPMAYDLDQARLRAALFELEEATSEQLTYEELRLSLMEQQTTSLDELVTLATQTNTLLSGGTISTPAGTVLTASGSSGNLVSEIQSLRAEIAENDELIIRYTKRTADVLEKFDIDGMPEVRS